MNDLTFREQPYADSRDAGTLQLDVLVSEARRFLLQIMVWVTFCLLTVTVYTFVKPTMYVAAAMLDLEPQRGLVNALAPSNAVPLPIDRTQIESQSLIIQSERNLRFVFDQLQLDQDGEYEGFFHSLFGTSKDMNFKVQAFRKFVRNVSVERVGESAIVDINFRASTPERAAMIANAIAAAFIHDKISVKAASAQASGEWLQGRVDDLQRQEELSARAVADEKLADAQFPAANARIINRASALNAAPASQPLLLLVAALLFGLTTSGLFLMLYTGFDQTIRHKSQVRQALGLRCLAALPELRDPHQLVMNASRDLWSRCKGAESFIDGLQAIRAQLISRKTGDAPLVIGVTSVAPQVGKSTIAACLAAAIARTETGVLLIDANFQSPSLSSWLAPPTMQCLAVYLYIKGGFAERSSESLSLPSFIQQTSRLSFLPGVSSGPIPELDCRISPAAVRSALNELKAYSYIVVDLPHVVHAGDLEPFRSVIDTYVLVVEAGKNSMGNLREAVDIFRDAGARIEGVVLNKHSVQASHFEKGKTVKWSFIRGDAIFPFRSMKPERHRPSPAGSPATPGDDAI